MGAVQVVPLDPKDKALRSAVIMSSCHEKNKGTKVRESALELVKLIKPLRL